MRTVLLVLAVAGLAGCVSTNVLHLGQPGQYPPVRPDEVRVYIKEADVKQPFAKIAIITAEGDYQSVDQEKMLKKIRQKAAEAGANAVILEDYTEPSTASKVWNSVLGTPANRSTRVLAVRVGVEES